MTILQRISSNCFILLLLVQTCDAFVPLRTKLPNHPIRPLPKSSPTTIVTHPHFPCTLPSTSSARSIQNQDEDEQAGGWNSLSTPLDRPVLAIVDLLSLFLFAGIGKASHSADGSLDIGAVLITALPFVTAWFVTSPLTGVYSDDDQSKNVISDAFVKTAKGWIIAVPLGCVLRGFIKGYVPPLPFVIVTMIATLVILGGARVVFSFAEDFFVEFVN
mmetsp:Transcript_9656/g.11559  ORF Transcript_9656/g.11559 Transcript_9656/m.11559 type:complete len:217 (-) Transcript_9656:860-1510(-)